MDLLDKYYKDLARGFNAKNQDSTQQEAAKQGVLRGGNSGCITEGGLILGSDPRLAVLRAYGIQSPTTMDDDLLFQAGHLNEEGLAEYLKLAAIEHQREEECQIKWECQPDVASLQALSLVPKGLGEVLPMTVTGRPDFKLKQYGADSQDVGIELKGIFGTGTLMDVSNFLGGVPKTENVCQAAHYSWQSGKVPWILQYINRSYHTVFYYGAGRFGQDHRSIKRDAKTDKPVVVGPNTSLYELGWDGDTLMIDGKPSIITASGIHRYYSYLTTCYHCGIIPKKSDAVDVYGTRLKKDKQDLYYDFEEANTSGSFESWLADCRHIAEGV